MNCDICGREIAGQAFRVKVEGAKMTVCNHCQTLGKPYAEESPPRVPATISSKTIPRTLRITPRHIPRRTSEVPKGLDDVDIAEDYGSKVRKHRMKLGLSQEDLAGRVKVKLSVIQKIETGKMIPDLRLCRDLEHELKIKLVTPREAEDATMPKTGIPEGVTLGDIIHVKGNTKPNLTD